MAEPTRRLAAILSVDVAGYSRLIGEDEDGTLAALRAWREGILTPAVAARRGRIVKHLGDGALVEFASAVDAVSCAMEAQTAAERAEEGGRRLVFRAGVNVGEIVVEDDDIYGDGVNVAARLQEVCEPGGLCISDEVRRLVERKVDGAFTDGGAQALKNIRESVRLWRWHAAGPCAPRVDPARAKAPAAAPEAQDTPSRPSIIVLPFDNMSADPEQEYFADGITEDIITDLSKASGLFVIARNTAFTFKGRAVSVADVCADLGVRYALEGSVRKAGNRVRINAQLIDGATSGHVWADRFDRDLDDVFALQDEVTRNIVGALHVALTDDERGRIGGRKAENIEAYDLVLKAAQAYYRFTREGIAEARRLGHEALAIDPDYARAHALVAATYLGEWNQAFAASSVETLDRSIEMARAAIALDPDAAEPYATLGHALVWKGEHDQAIALARKAVALDPNSALGLSYLSMVLGWSGETDEAVALGEAAIRLDPRAGFVSLWSIGHAHCIAGRFECALHVLRDAVAQQAQFMPSHLFLAIACQALGREGEAADEIRIVHGINPRATLDWARDTLPYRRPEDAERTLALWQAAGAHG